MKRLILESEYQRVLDDPNRLASFVVMPDGQIVNDLSLAFPLEYEESILAIVPGSFNPLHDAHKAIYNEISDRYASGKRTARAFEISINRRGKESLSLDDLKTRLKQFEWYAPIWITNALYFSEKAGLVSQQTIPHFQIGYDTAERLIQDHGIIGVQGIIAHFVVFPRKINDVVLSLDTLKEKYGLIPFNMSKGRNLGEITMGISSTQLRNEKTNHV
jgi:hypothetical protein